MFNEGGDIMMCPHCGKDAEVYGDVFRNLDIYGGTKLAKTHCCGKGIYVTVVKAYEVIPCNDDRTEDDWGNTILK